MDATIDQKQEAEAADQMATTQKCAPCPEEEERAVEHAVREALRLRLRDAPAERLEAMLAKITAALADRQPKP